MFKDFMHKAEKHHVTGAEILFLKKNQLKRRLGMRKKIHQNSFMKSISDLQKQSPRFQNGETLTIKIENKKKGIVTIDKVSASPQLSNSPNQPDSSKSRSVSRDRPISQSPSHSRSNSLNRERDDESHSEVIFHVSVSKPFTGLSIVDGEIRISEIKIGSPLWGKA